MFCVFTLYIDLDSSTGFGGKLGNTWRKWKTKKPLITETGVELGPGIAVGGQ